MTERLKTGDLVAIGSNSKTPIIGIVVKELAFYSGRRCGGIINPMARKQIEANPNPRILEVRFAQYKSDQFFEEECRKLTNKEIFKAKLAGHYDDILRQ